MVPLGNLTQRQRLHLGKYYVTFTLLIHSHEEPPPIGKPQGR
jgi:hypothetical protein